MARVTVVAGGNASARAEAVEARVREAGAVTRHEARAREWPFLRAAGDGAPAGSPLLVRVHNLHEAFPAGQTGGTRVVLTQSAWQMQRWIDWMDRRGDVTMVADAEIGPLRSGAPEAFARRGPWAAIALIDLGPDAGPAAAAPQEDSAGPVRPILRAAFATPDPAERLALCRRAADAAPNDPVVLTALGSAYMEVGDLDAAQPALESAVGAAPDWEAAHFELGKLWLRRDDMEQASRAFAEAGRLMPGFSAAFSNLGATLGELDRPEEARRAFEQALAFDPNGYPILNNIGVVSRELGRLDESEAAFRNVTAIAPEFVFGHYNLGHTLFLQGRYQAALSAYLEGQRRDPEKNPRQASRVAVTRLAAGDPEGALDDLRRLTPVLPLDQRRDILEEAQEILWALLATQPAMRGWQEVAKVVQEELRG